MVDNYASLADWASTVERLATFGRSLDAMHAQETGIKVVPAAGPDFVVSDLHLELPDRSVLLDAASLHLEPGTTTALRGRSGTGKSTLFRAMAGIWPFGSGTVEKPPGRVLFLPQKPYIPLGTLRRAVSYPAAIDAYPQADIEAALTDAGLAKLIPELDVDMAWAQRLSGGEQQRLALARARCSHPPGMVVSGRGHGQYGPAGRGGAVLPRCANGCPTPRCCRSPTTPEVAKLHDSQLILHRGLGSGILSVEAAE